jgi:DNA ligase D-like protein (predicted ligase)
MAARSSKSVSQELPRYVEPMLAKPGEPFDSADYLFEIKWDGTRTLAFVELGGYRLVNRRRIDMTDRYPEFTFLADAPAGTVLDGETIVFKDGKPDFNMLQSREQARSPLKIRTLARSVPATFVVFDLLYERFAPLLWLPLYARRERLGQLVRKLKKPQLVLSEGVVGQGKTFFQEACRLGLEGVVAKRLKSPYLPGRRTDAWIKIKRHEIVDCLIMGFVPSGKDDFGSLIIAAEDKGQLRCVGKVGTGFDTRLRRQLNALMWSRLRAKPLVPCKIKGRWIESGLYCRVSCMERTAGGELRAPVFEELLQE